MIADFSHHQGDINWDKVNQALDLVILRSSIGLNMDSKYAEYVSKCTVPFGVYHYLKASTTAEAESEAKFFYSHAIINGNKPLFFCADIEHSTQNSSNVNAISTVFADTLRQLGATKLGLYIGQALYPNANKNKYDFVWIPRYGKNTGEADANYAPIYPCDLWQYTSVGKVDGVNGNVDLNKIYGTKNLQWFTQKEEKHNMSEKFTNVHFVEFLKKMIGQPYWYGTCVYKCTQALLTRKTAQYPAHYTSSRTSRYKNDIAKNWICTDCIGLAKGYAWTNGGANVIESLGKSTTAFTNSYTSNGMPDKSANGMFEYAKGLGLDWGTIDTIPEIPGIAVRYDGHVGYYIGNGKVIEARGFNYGVVLTELKSRPWLHWYKLPVIKYITDTPATSHTTSKLGDRLLKEGLKGDDVKELQNLLNSYLNLKLNVDGDFGPATKKAVEKLQSKLQVTVDGAYGAKTHTAFMSVLSDTHPDEETTVTPATTTAKILKTSCAANVRMGDSTAYSIITSLAKDTIVTPILNNQNEPILSANKWYAIKCHDKIGWISATVVDIH